MNDEPLPVPGTPVRGSRTGRPLMATFDLLGRRWMLRVLWELRTGPIGFRVRPVRHCWPTGPGDGRRSQAMPEAKSVSYPGVRNRACSCLRRTPTLLPSMIGYDSASSR